MSAEPLKIVLTKRQRTQHEMLTLTAKQAAERAQVYLSACLTGGLPDDDTDFSAYTINYEAGVITVTPPVGSVA